MVLEQQMLLCCDHKMTFSCVFSRRTLCLQRQKANPWRDMFTGKEVRPQGSSPPPPVTPSPSRVRKYIYYIQYNNRQIENSRLSYQLRKQLLQFWFLLQMLIWSLKTQKQDWSKCHLVHMSLGGIQYISCSSLSSSQSKSPSQKFITGTHVLPSEQHRSVLGQPQAPGS